MTLSENYETKRKRFKDGHYWAITYDESGKQLGKKLWKWPKDMYGNAIVKKNISPNEVAQHATRHDYQQRLAKEEITKSFLKERELAIPDRIEFSEWNIRYPYEYEVKMRVYNSDGDIEEKYVTVVNEELMTRKQIREALNKIIEYYQYESVKSFRVKRLYLKKE